MNHSMTTYSRAVDIHGVYELRFSTENDIIEIKWINNVEHFNSLQRIFCHDFINLSLYGKHLSIMDSNQDLVAFHRV